MDAIDPALLDSMTALLSRAGRAVLDVACSPIAVQTKPDHSPVTAADRASHDLITEGLGRLLPGVPVVSEEGSRPTRTELGTTFVVVDPLDGTKEFIRGIAEYTINLAVIVAARPVTGLLYWPARGLLYRGRCGHGAERIVLPAGAPGGDAVAIRTRSRPADGLVALISRSHPDAATEGMLARLPVRQRVPCGSAAKFALLAEGSADVYPRLAPTHEWDVAAGHAVLTAAGGVMRRPDGTELAYGDVGADFLIPGFVAWGDGAAMR